jgi:hypothetical protein
VQAFGRCGRIARLIFKGVKMDAFAQPQDRSATIGPRFDHLALAPAAAAICYPFLLRAFHAVVGTLRLDRLRLRGLFGDRDEFLLAASPPGSLSVQNLRKLAKLIHCPR